MAKQPDKHITPLHLTEIDLVWTAVGCENIFEHETARDYHLGWRLATPHRSDLSLDIKVLYRNHDGKNPEHATVFEIIAHW